MTNEPERDGETEYTVPLAHRVRTWVAVGALGVGGAVLATGHPAWLVVPICLYVPWMFLRTWLNRRAFERTWVASGGEIRTRDYTEGL